MTQRLWSASISLSRRNTPSTFIAAMIASTFATSRPSEKFGTHSTRDIGDRKQVTADRQGRKSSTSLLCECLLVHNIGHLSHIAAVVLLQNIDQALYTSPCHADIGIGRKSSFLRSAGEVMKQSAPVLNFGIP